MSTDWNFFLSRLLHTCRMKNVFTFITLRKVYYFLFTMCSNYFNNFSRRPANRRHIMLVFHQCGKVWCIRNISFLVTMRWVDIKHFQARKIRWTKNQYMAQQSDSFWFTTSNWTVKKIRQSERKKKNSNIVHRNLKFAKLLIVPVKDSSKEFGIYFIQYWVLTEFTYFYRFDFRFYL